MDIQTLTIIVSSIALAVALESTILCVWLYRKISKRLDTLPKETSLSDNNFRQLVDKLSMVPDSMELQQPAKEETTEQAVMATSPNEKLLAQAYDTFYIKYQQTVADMTVDNMEQQAEQLATLLLEMGYWLKDFLPVCRGDFNATATQKANAERIALAKQQWLQELEQAPQPNTNPYETPLEVMALVQKLQQWGVDDFRFLISGYQYKAKQKQA